ncbi:MAG: cytochrome b N-terminal domain-containing protein [Candidatus Sulfotelmatobacter sp.]
MARLIRDAVAWFESRTGLIAKLKPLLEHPVPKQSKWAYVFGSATLFSFVLQVVTGVVLATMFVPSTNSAFQSLSHIQNDALFGHIVRGMHYFGASAMFMFIGIHMLRVFLYASYKYPREVNWLSGVVLLILTLAMGFTGQLMRWDQNAVWSVNIAAKQAARTPFIGGFMSRLIYGGDHLSGLTLTRFFDLHVFVIPATIVAIVAFHLYLVLYNGISEPPRAGAPVNPATYKAQYKELLNKEGVPFWPDAAWRDALFGSLVIAACITFAVMIGAPKLVPPADPSVLRADPRPDWYLLWYFAVLALSPHALESYIIVLAPLLIFGSMFLLPFFFNKGERSPRRRPWAVAWVLVVCLGVLGLWREGKIAPWSPRFDSPPLPNSLPATASSAAMHGQVLFHDKGCEYCHTVNGLGGLRGPNLSDVGNRLTQQQMILRILNGGRNMPAFAGILHPDETAALVEYLKTRKLHSGPDLTQSR